MAVADNDVPVAAQQLVQFLVTRIDMQVGQAHQFAAAGQDYDAVDTDPAQDFRRELFVAAAKNESVSTERRDHDVGVVMLIEEREYGCLVQIDADQLTIADRIYPEQRLGQLQRLSDQPYRSSGSQQV